MWGGPMADLERGFPEELQEVLFDVAKDNWARAEELPARARDFFFDYAYRQLVGGLQPAAAWSSATKDACEELAAAFMSQFGGTMTDRIGTALLLLFMAGREHAIRGYRPPYPKEAVPNDDLPDPQGIDMPANLEDEVERMFNQGHEH